MKMINQIELCPSCSEYVWHLKLTTEEEKEAIKFAKKLGLDLKNKDKYLKKYIEHTTGEGIGFIERECVEPYTQIKSLILARRLKIDRKKINELVKKLR